MTLKKRMTALLLSTILTAGIFGQNSVYAAETEVRKTEVQETEKKTETGKQENEQKTQLAQLDTLESCVFLMMRHMYSKEMGKLREC